MKGYAEDIECIVPSYRGAGGIYISNIEAASNLKTLNQHNIKAVITACKGYLLKHTPDQLPYYLYLPATDHESFDISKYFDQAADFIQDKLKTTNVLVHCMAGISRSVTLVLAYLIKKHGHTTQSSYSLVKKQRKKIHPNSGFIKQLQKLEEMLSIKNRENQFRSYQRNLSLNVSRASNRSASYEKPNLYQSYISNSPKFQPSQTTSSFGGKSMNNSSYSWLQSHSRSSSSLNIGPQSKTSIGFCPSSTTNYKNSFQTNMKEYDRRLKQDIKRLQIENMKLQMAIEGKQKGTGLRKPMSELYGGN